MFKHKLTRNKTLDYASKQEDKSPYILRWTEWDMWLLRESKAQTQFYRKQQTFSKILLKSKNQLRSFIQTKNITRY